MNKTGIRWTDYSSNPIRAVDLETGKEGWACSRVSPGCDHCYAATLNRRWGTHLDYTVESIDRIRFKLDYREFDAWERLKEPSRILIVDMSDLFHEALTDDYRNIIFGAMEACRWHTFQVLTKRPGRMLKYTLDRVDRAENFPSKTMPKNIWFGTSVEDALRKPRIDVLRRVPAHVRFLSLEPLLGDLGDLDLYGINWVIVGGESGPRYRPMSYDWARNIRDQCLEQKVAFFYKQSSGIRTEMGQELDGVRWEQYPE